MKQNMEESGGEMKRSFFSIRSPYIIRDLNEAGANE